MGGSVSADLDVDLRALWRGVVARKFLVALVVVAVTAAALAFVIFSDSHYRAATRVLIETRESVWTRPPEGPNADRPSLDGEGVASQVEVISSQDILRTVVRDLDLTSHAAFAGERGLVSRLLVSLGLGSEGADLSVEDRIISKLRSDLVIYRVEGSRVIVIEYSSADPQLAARVPNAIADAYIAVQRAAIRLSTADATEWLAPEIADLRQRVREAETRVAEYRARTGLLAAQNSEVLATQQLAETSSELSRVRADRASAVARAETVRAALRGGGSVDALPEVLASPLVQRLIERRVQLNSEIAELATVYLENHPRIRALRSQLSDLDRQIRSESAKILEGLEGEAARAQRREAELTAELNRLKVASADAGAQQVELRALERDAAAERELLESYLTRFREASSRSERNYLPVDARIFSRASPPAEPYFPKPVPIIGAAFAGSLLLAVLGVLLAELFSGRAFRPAGVVVAEPIRHVALPQRPLTPGPQGGGLAATENAAATPVDASAVMLDAPSGVRHIVGQGNNRAIFLSPEGEVGIPASILTAREAADGGLRVIYLDLTESGAPSTALLESAACVGLSDLLCAEARFADVIHGDLYSTCHVIPHGTADRERAMRGAERLPIILAALAQAYDLIVIECGGEEPAHVARLVDGYSSVMVGAADAQSREVAAALIGLEEAGIDAAALVSARPGMLPPGQPKGRSAA